MEDMKRCSWCGETKPPDQYYKDERRRGGLQSRCIDCCRERENSRYIERQSEPKTVPMEKQCPSCGVVKFASSFYVSKSRSQGLESYCKTCLSRRKKKSKYGLDAENLDKLITNQNERCAICGRSQDIMALCVDHDHITGNVRGLLCASCNHVLGHAHDNVEVLLSAVAYLQDCTTSIVAV